VSTVNPELNFTLDDAVAEVLGLLTGLDLTYEPELDRYRSITRCLNRALRANALEKEWSWYNSTVSVGAVVEGATTATLPATLRPRITADDAVRLVENVDGDDLVRVWAYFLPRDALHKYGSRGGGLWVASRRDELMFSRPFYAHEAGWDIQVPAMREPTMFRLPPMPESEDDPVVPVDPEIRDQPIDFAYPDIVVARAAFMYAQTDPVMQPRVQTLEAQYKDIMYQVIERDDRNTDSPFLNEFFVPVQSGLRAPGHLQHGHPHSDERR
jgi:hypothetical protein